MQNENMAIPKQTEKDDRSYKEELAYKTEKEARAYKEERANEIREYREDMSYKLENVIRNRIGKPKEYVFVCVGVDKITGDCIGPLVGSNLEKIYKNEQSRTKIKIYGNLEKNINYSNVENIKNKIEKEHTESCVIVVDAALSSSKNIGKIYIENGKTNLGMGLGKRKIQLGDISIKAVVGRDYKNSKSNYKELQNVSLNTVMQLVEKISSGIYETIKNIEV